VDCGVCVWPAVLRCIEIQKIAGRRRRYQKPLLSFAAAAANLDAALEKQDKLKNFK
jgi:hypothetical protein